VRSSDISVSSSSGSTAAGTPTAAFQTLLGLGSEHGPVRSATFTGAQDLPCYSESDELPNENTATE